LISGVNSALGTGWQYVFGIGTRLVQVPPETLLYQDGLRSGDLVQLVNGHQTRSVYQWQRAIVATRNDQTLKVHVARQAPVYPLVTYLDLTVDREHLDQWLNLPGSKVKRGVPLRARGHLDHFMRYAGVMMEVALLAFGLLMARPQGKLTTVLLALATLVLMAALFATVSRAYIIGTLLGCVFMIWAARPRLRVVAIAALLIGLAGTAGWVREERGKVWLSAGDQFRFEIWKDSLDLIPKHPWLGVGLDSVNQYAEQWQLHAFKEFNFVAHFHSTYVQLAVDCGLPCLATWIWLLVAYVVFLWRSWKNSGDWEPFARGAVLGIFAAANVFIMASALNYTLADGEVAAIAWLFMGLAIATARVEGAVSHPERSGPIRAADEPRSRRIATE
jgi:hypothetical protein